MVLMLSQGPDIAGRSLSPKNEEGTTVLAIPSSIRYVRWH